jgi:hypothetical protein
MVESIRERLALVLYIGDIVTIAIVTMIGFASHGTLSDAGSRMLSTFIPLLISWFLAAPFLGLYDPEKIINYRELWRVVLAGVFAAPLAALLRGILLNAPVQTVFVLVLGGVSILGMLIWRAVYMIVLSRNR